MVKYLLLLILLPIGYILNAQALITDRPDQTESTSIVGKGGFQLETGTSIVTEEGISQLNLNNSLFRVGVSDKLEFRLVTDVVVDPRDLHSNGTKTIGLSDLEIGLKYNFFAGSTNISYLGHAILPTGTDFLTQDEYGLSSRLLIDGDFSSTVSYGINLGYDYLGEGLDFLAYTLAFGFAINDEIGCFIEVFGDAELEGDHLSNFDLGFTYLVNDNLQLDISTGAGINNNMNFLSAGLSWRSLKIE